VKPDVAQVRDLALRVALKFSPQSPGEDIAQDVVLRWLMQDPPPQDWRAWVATVARNRVRDVMGAERGGRELPDGRVDQLVELGTRIYGPSAQVIDRHQLRQMLGPLSERELEVLLHSLDGASNAEIADWLGYASAASVATLLSRTKRKIRDANPDTDLALRRERIY
jgi:RNA polymerase sigma factor (sigma-70 family)